MSTMLNLIELRQGGVGDLDLVDTIMAEAFDPRFGEAWTRGQCLGMLAMPGVALTLALLEGRPAGFTLVRRVIDETDLLLIATHPTARRRGVAAALLRGAIIAARNDGVRRVHLEVRENNDAIKLYHGAGFIKVGTRRHYYRGDGGQAFDAMTYNHELA